MLYSYISNDFLRATLKLADRDELKPIFEQLGIPYSGSIPVRTLVIRISQLGGNSFKNLFKDGEAVGYLNLVILVAKALGVPDDGLAILIRTDEKANASLALLPAQKQGIGNVICALEDEILEVIAKDFYQRMSAEQRNTFDAELQRIATEHSDNPSRSIVGAGGALLLGNLGGFGTYMLMSSLLSTLSLGTLGFGAYTAAASALSIVLGPVGWATLGAFAIFKLSDPSLKKLLPIVIAVALIRRKHEK